MQLPTRSLAVAGALSFAVGLSACGGSDDESPEAADVATDQPAQAVDTGGDSASGDGGGSSAGSVPAGEAEQATAGSVSVGEIYQGIAAAARAGVAATDVPVGKTLEASDGNDALTKVCSLMSEQAKRQTIVYAKASSSFTGVEWTCEKATGLLLRRASQGGGLAKSLRAKVVRVDVDGDRATASVRFRGKGAVSTIPLVREDGVWKLDASPTGQGGQ